MRKTFSLLILAILLTSIFSALSKIQTAKAGTIVVPDNYPTIQAAINAASFGDAIYVKVGTYHENVLVNKAVSIVGENKATTIIDGGNTGDVVGITVDNVSMSKFTIRNSGPGPNWDSGIALYDARSCKIADNYVTNNRWGICLSDSSNNQVINNTIPNTGNSGGGILVMFSSFNNTISQNTVAQSDGSSIYMQTSCANNTISFNTLSSPNRECIILHDAWSNNITCNTISSSYRGLRLTWSRDNWIYYNSFINNEDQAYDDNVGNHWDNSYPSGGNYWSDYVDVDEKHGPNQNKLGSDGIWDHTRIIGNYSQDMYPLVRPWANLIVPDNYPTIQAAINAANPGDTIYVKAATYHETINVEKTVTLRGENRDTTIIDGGGNQNVVFVTADNVTIIGFTIRNSGAINPGGYGGIGVSGADHVIVENNNLVSNDDGIWIYDSNYDSFANNNFSYNAKAGVYTRYASGMIIADNIVANNDWGIVLRTGTATSTVADNSVYSNGYSGIQVGPESELNTIICNTVTHNDYGIAVFSPGNNVFSDNNVSSSKYDGIGLQETTNNTVTRNILTGNKMSGIDVYYADGNTFNCNKIMYNGSPAVSAGVYLESSYNNLFYHNELIANTQSQVYSSNSINTWNAGYPSGGNYWNDYTDIDEKSGQNQDQPGSDGIWDHPYFIDGNNLDNYPLVNPWTPWGDWQHYHDYSEIVNTLFYLNDQYPNIAELFSIGKSWQGKDVYCLKLTNETNTHPKPKVLFVGYHHAREPISAELPLCFAVKAATSFGSDPAITRMLNYSEVYIVVALNIDGFEAVKKNDWQRKNAHPTDEDSDGMFDEDPPMDTDADGSVSHLYFWNGTYYSDIRYEGIDTDSDGNLDWIGGVDLNRNYGYQWNAPCDSGSSNMSAEDYRGPAPFSEPETQAVRDIALRNDFDYAVSFHSGAQVILYPWTYTTSTTSDNAIFTQIASNLSTLVGVPYAQGCALYTASGTWGDWMYGNRSTLAFECEIFGNDSAWQTWPGSDPNTWWEKGIFQAFNPDARRIETTVQRWLPVFNYIADRAIAEAYDVAIANNEIPMFEDNFESYAPGSFPSPPWQWWFHGAGPDYNQIVNYNYWSPSQSLTMCGLPGWASVAAVRLPYIRDVIGYEVMVRADNYGSGTGAWVGFNEIRSGTTWSGWAGVAFISDGTIRTGSTILQTYNLYLWYKIRVIFNMDTRTYSVWINNVLKAADLLETNPDDPKANLFYFGLASDHGGQQCYFDDVKVLSSSIPQKTVVGQNALVNMAVAFRNQGEFAETLRVTVYANLTATSNVTTIGTFANVTLNSGDSQAITFTWNTTGFAKGNYTISAYAEPVSGETDTADNSFADGVVHVGVPGNVNYFDGSRMVDMIDLWLIQKYYGAVKGQPSPLYVPNYDIDDNGKIDMIDLWTAQKHFGQTEP